MAIMLVEKQFVFHEQDPNGDYIINRVRYGTAERKSISSIGDKTCRYYGWGSRRNGFLVPLLIDLQAVQVHVLPIEDCRAMWRGYADEYLCIQHPPCKSEKYGALCPDDMGSIIVCSGFALGMMTSRMIDRPCGVGFLNLAKYNKFLTCAADDSRDIISHDYEGFHTIQHRSATLQTVSTHETTDVLTTTTTTEPSK